VGHARQHLEGAVKVCAARVECVQLLAHEHDEDKPDRAQRGRGVRADDQRRRVRVVDEDRVGASALLRSVTKRILLPRAVTMAVLV
jgi:hypothetical protein